MTLYFEDSTTSTTTVNLRGATAGRTCRLRRHVPGAANRRFAIIVQSVGSPTPPQIVVERSMYSNAGGVAVVGRHRRRRDAPRALSLARREGPPIRGGHYGDPTCSRSKVPLRRTVRSLREIDRHLRLERHLHAFHAFERLAHRVEVGAGLERLERLQLAGSESSSPKSTSISVARAPLRRRRVRAYDLAVDFDCRRSCARPRTST